MVTNDGITDFTLSFAAQTEDTGSSPRVLGSCDRGWGASHQMVTQAEG